LHGLGTIVLDIGGTIVHIFPTVTVNTSNKRDMAMNHYEQKIEARRWLKRQGVNLEN